MTSAAKRETLKKSILKIAKFSNSITEDTDIFDIRSHLDRLIDSWTKYEEMHMKVIEETGEKGFDLEQIEYDDTETLVLKLDATLKRELQAREVCKNPDQNQTLVGQRQQQQQHNISGAEHPDYSGLRVPRITIPDFSGEYLQWPSFRDLFLTMVGDNPKVPKVQKLSYLKKVVIGKTNKMIRNLKITNENYDVAWEILKSRFENERIIVHELLNNIYKIPDADGSADGIKQILDTTTESLIELKNLERPVEYYGDWLVFIIVKKLDELSLDKWNELVGDDKDVTEWSQLYEFLNARFRILEGTKPKESKCEVLPTKTSLPRSSNLSSCHVSDNSKKKEKLKCYYCNQNHRARSCNNFRKKNPTKRRQIVESANLCLNCLSPGHKLVECSSSRSCFKCGQRHHSMLHLDSTQRVQKVNLPLNASPKDLSSKQALETSSSGSSASSHHVECSLESNQDVVLATAIIVFKLDSNKVVTLRALLDQGSQMSLISSFAAKQLRLKCEPYIGVPLTGAGGEEIQANRGVVNFTFQSRINDAEFQTEALVLDTVSQYQQSNNQVFVEASKKFPRIELADPNIESFSPIDVLLAADVYAQVVLEGVKKFCGVLVQNTSLGWILSGQYRRKSDSEFQHLSINHSHFPIDKLLRSFWEIEEIPADSLSLLSVDELACEKHYKETHSRNSHGRYVVRLPFKLNAKQMELGYSRGVAVSSQIRMENRFNKNPILKEKYTAFMSESLKMGHMELVKDSDIDKPSNECYYMPHHAVLRDSQTTALRVVFNASQKTSTGNSLNDKLHTGAKLQTDLFNILTRFRKYKICYMADIEKMYRRILVHRKDRDFQRIIWRENSNDALRTYRMRVVTDGTSSAPFLAIRTVQQLAIDEKLKYPLAYPKPPPPFLTLFNIF